MKFWEGLRYIGSEIAKTVLADPTSEPIYSYESYPTDYILSATDTVPIQTEHYNMIIRAYLYSRYECLLAIDASRQTLAHICDENVALYNEYARRKEMIAVQDEKHSRFYTMCDGLFEQSLAYHEAMRELVPLENEDQWGPFAQRKNNLLQNVNYMHSYNNGNVLPK